MADNDADTTQQGNGDDQSGIGNQSGADDQQSSRRGDDDRGSRDQSQRRTRARSGGQGDGKGDDTPSDRSDTSTSDRSSDSEPRFTQADLDKQIEKRLERERKRYADYDDVKASASDTKAQMDKLRDDLGKALGFKADDAPPDPATLQQTITERESKVSELERTVSARDEEITRLTAELGIRDAGDAAWREATKQGLDVAALMDSRSFDRRLRALDPAAEGFAKSLADEIKAVVADNPALRIKAEVPDPGRAGIGTAGARDDAAVKPGTGRLRAAYSTT